VGWGLRDEKDTILVSNTAKLTTVWANPGHGVTANTPLVLLHAGKTDLKTAVASPAKFLLFAAAVTDVLLPSFLA
jgi:hypothetical protein